MFNQFLTRRKAQGDSSLAVHDEVVYMKKASSINIEVDEDDDDDDDQVTSFNKGNGGGSGLQANDYSLILYENTFSGLFSGFVQISNQSAKVKLFKIKCSRPDNYRVQAACGFVEAMSYTNVRVEMIDRAKHSRKDSFAIQQTECPFKLLSYIFSPHFLKENPVPSKLFAAAWKQLEGQDSMQEICREVVSVQIEKSKARKRRSSSDGVVNTKKMLNKVVQRLTTASSDISGYEQQATPTSQITCKSDRISCLLQQESLLQQQQAGNIERKSRFEQYGSKKAEQMALQLKSLYEQLLMKSDENDKLIFALQVEHKKTNSDLQNINRSILDTSLAVASQSAMRNSISMNNSAIIALVAFFIGLFLGN